MSHISSFPKMKVGYISCLRHFLKNFSFYTLSFSVMVFFSESSLNWKYTQSYRGIHTTLTFLCSKCPLSPYQVPNLWHINKYTLRVMDCESESQGKLMLFYAFLIVREGALYQDKLSSHNLRSLWWIDLTGEMNQSL